MSPSIEPSAEHVATTAQEDLVPPALLEDAEVVLLATKPSGWFVLLVSWRVLALAGLVAVVLILAEPVLHAAVASRQAVILLCVAACCLRVIFGCFQWLGRLYVLTNKRILRIKGVMRAEVFACPLRRIRRVLPGATVPERLLGVGSLYFQTGQQDGADGAWIHLARPLAIRDMIEEAIRRAT